MNQRVMSRGAMVGTALILWALVAVGTYSGWIHGTNHRDFYPRWAGARLALFEGRDLYSDDTTRAMQRLLYARELAPDEDPQAFAYPAILVPLLLPFWWVGNVEVATALWEATSVLLMLGSLLWLRATVGGPPPWAAALLLVWYYPILMVFQGQITALPLAALSAALCLSLRRRDFLAGAVLVAGLVKPEQVAVPIAAFLVVALVERRWRLIGGFAAAASLLFGASLLINGWWIPRWLDAVGRYAIYAPTVWGLGAAWQVSPILAVTLVLIAFYALTRLRWSTVTAIEIGVPLGLLVLPQTLIWGLTLLILPLALCWRRSARAVGALWLSGWLLLAVDWRIPSLILPVLTLILAIYVNRSHASHPASEARRLI